MSPITLLDPAQLAGQPQQNESGTLTRTLEAADFGGGLTAGLWEGDASGEQHFESYPYDELMSLIEGSITLELADGSSQTFTAGDTFVVAKGTELTWKQQGLVRKYYVTRDGV